MIIVETERLILRHFHIFDADAMNRVFGDVEVMRYGPGVQSQQWVRDWLRDCLRNYYQKLGVGPWAVVKKRSGEVMGYTGLFHYPDIAGRPEIEVGYRLGRAHWGRGYATEAVIAVRDYSFNVLGLPRLVALVDPMNVASIRVAKKAGMHFECEVMLPGYDHPDHLYAIANPLRGL